MFINSPTLSQLAAERCFDRITDNALKISVREYKKARAVILNSLKNLPISSVAPADGAFYIYVDIKDHTSAKYNTEYMCNLFLEEERVAFTPVSSFEFWNLVVVGSRSMIDCVFVFIKLHFINHF